MKSYSGSRGANRVVRVFVMEDGQPAHILDPAPSQLLWNHSPDGFEYGYDGSGPSQLALAILLDYTSDDILALASYQEFKWRVIAKLSGNYWEIPGTVIDDFLIPKTTP
jgi:hypothetical protein